MVILNKTTVESNSTFDTSQLFSLLKLGLVNYKIPLGLLITIISSIAIFGNLLVITAIVVDKSLRTVIY